MTNRWSCSPGWSWYGGTSLLNAQNQYAGVAGIWSKTNYSGDLSTRFYTGPKMLPVPNTTTVLEQMMNFNLTLCGDGKDLRSGYAFLVAPGGADKAQLLRKGAVVAETNQLIMPREGHNRWLELTAEKIGKTVRLLFDGQPLLTYNDPDPLPGGYVGLWTENNGILVPRVTISYAEQRGQSLSGLLAPPVVASGLDADLGKTLEFTEGVAGWTSLDSEAPVSKDTQVFRSPPGSLSYQFQPRKGAFPVLISPRLHVSGAKSVSLSLRASLPDRVVLTLMEEDMSRYITVVNIPADQWANLELPLSQFKLATDSSDENGKLDSEEIGSLTFTDMDAVHAMSTDAEKAFQKRQFWVDDVKFAR
ncbi:MAG: hypothetical protein HY318_04520 [Armatimonadetes bacterium]|nr:hypothetical protein [Armatimonadota bacterium]